ncbi:MAG: hypothetical protein HPY50_03205 [Firmicutes bacterium]|nr:hypothetical protein [Bacillota bacterium]
MRKPLLILSLILVTFFSLTGAAEAAAHPFSDVQWVRTLGDGTARGVWQTSDGGYLLTGWTKGQAGSGSDIFLIKTDGQGDKTWETLIRGNGYSCGYGVIQNSDGGAVVVGDTKSKTGYDHDVIVAKVDAGGNLVWERNFGGPYCDYGASVVQTGDGGYLVAGGTESYGAGVYDAYLIRLDGPGQEIWEKTYGGKGSDCGYALLQDPDGGFTVAGNSDSTESGKTKVYLFQTDAGGRLLWERKIGGNSDTYGWSLERAPDGGYLVAGEVAVVGASGGGLKSYLAKTDYQGRPTWERIYGGDSYSTVYAILLAEEGDYILVGKQEAAGGVHDLFILKTDRRGDALGERTLANLGGSCAYAGQQTRDGGFILAGEQNSGVDGAKQVLLLKLAPDRPDNLRVLLIILAALIALLFLLDVIEKRYLNK